MGKRGAKTLLDQSSQNQKLLSLKPYPQNLKTRLHSHNPKAIIHFAEQMPVLAGIREGKRIRLLKWQKELIRELYRKDCKQLVCSLPRKCGKSTLTSILAVYMLTVGAEMNGEIYLAAINRLQASVIWDMCAKLIYRVKELNDRCVVKTHDKIIFHKPSGSILRALSADAQSAHGLNASFVIVDELGQAKKRDLYDALATAQGGRKHPKMLVISTQAEDDEHVMSQLVDDGLKSDDPAFKTILHSAPLEADPWCEKTWQACNPSLGETRTLSDIRQAARLAQRVKANETAFRRYFLNQRIKEDTSWLEIEHWDACVEDFNPEDLLREDAIMSADLASVRDTCAISLYFPKTKHLLCWHFTNQAQVDKSDERLPYKTWVANEQMIATSGNTTNKLDIVHHIAKCVANYNVLSFTYDRWGMGELQRLLEENNVDIAEYSPHGQGYKDMSPAIKAFETAILNKDIKIKKDPVLRWQMQGVAVDTDPSGNVKFTKAKSMFPIDAMVSCCMAVGRGILAETFQAPSVFSI